MVVKVECRKIGNRSLKEMVSLTAICFPVDFLLT